MAIPNNLLRRIIVASAFLAPLVLSAQSPRWVSNGPYGGQITALVIDSGGTIFAGTNVGVFRSYDHGLTWNESAAITADAEIEPPVTIYSLAIDSSGHILAVTGSGLFRSSNGGDSWWQTDLDRTMAVWSIFHLIAVDAEGRLFVGASNLYRLAPGRDQPIGVGIPGLGSRLQAFTVASGRRMFAAEQGGRFFRSSDGGDSWTFLNQWAQDTAIEVHELVSLPHGILLAGTSRGLLRSTDDGSTWLSDESIVRERRIGSLLVSGDDIYAGTSRFGIFHSTDFGVSWTEINTGLENPDISALAIGASGILYAGTAYGMHRSTNGGASWQASNIGLTAVGIGSLLATPSGTILATTRAGVFRSTDGGASWLDANYRLSDRRVESIRLDSAGAVWVHTFDASLFRSTDDGASWIRTGEGPRRGHDGGFAVGRPGELLLAMPATVAYPGGVHSTTDGGATWTELLDSVDISQIMVVGETIILVTSMDGIYRCTSARNDWTRVPLGSGQNGRQNTSVAVDAAGTMYVGTLAGTWRSTDDGLTWVPTGPAAQSWVMALGTGPNGQVFASLYGQAYSYPPPWIALSTDRGVTWRDVSAGLERAQPGEVIFRGRGEFFLGTNRGVYQTSNLVSAVEPVADGLFALELEESRPNPAGDQCVISFSVPATQVVELSLFDVEGNRLAVLMEGRVEAGRHSVDLNLSAIQNGIYLCRLVADGKVKTQVVTAVR